MNNQMASRLKSIRIILWAVVLIAGLAAGFLYLYKPVRVVEPEFGGPFSLQSTLGGRFTETDLAGTPSLVFFGYTFCPDVCPTTLAETVGWRNQLGFDGEELRVIFASVDPERDDLENLSAYLSAFGPDIIGLTGTLEEVAIAKTAFGVFSEKVADDGASQYLVDHTASVFLYDRTGAFFGTIGFGEDSDTALAKINRLVGS